MNATTDISAILLDQADRLFREHATKAVLEDADRGEWPAALWRAVEEAGFPLALVPEEAGGVGLALEDALRLVRRSARHAAPIPLAETMIAAACWAAASGRLVEGPLSVAPVLPTDAVAAARASDGWVLTGEAHRVPWGSRAGAILFHAREPDGRAVLALVPASSCEVTRRSNLAGEPRDLLVLRGVTVGEEAVRPAPPACRDGFLRQGALFRAQQMVGAMERCLEHALAHAGERRQFGRPIGKFQAVQQMLAEAAGHCAAAAAAADLASGDPEAEDFSFRVAVAKARAGEAAGIVAEICHQVHGAMGFTQEHSLHFATRRLWSWRDEFGGESVWQAEIGRTVCRAGGEALWPLLAGA